MFSFVQIIQPKHSISLWASTRYTTKVYVQLHNVWVYVSFYNVGNLRNTLSCGALTCS